MTLMEIKCAKCGEKFKVPVGPEARAVTCPACGARVGVPREAPSDRGPDAVQLTCPDCGKAFSVPASRRSDVVDCPSCGSWVQAAGQRRGGILYHRVPMPFQFTPSVRRWLRFLAGLTLIGGLLSAVLIGILYGTKEIPVQTGTPPRVINLPGVLGALATALGTIVATVALMALYWILQNVDAIHYHLVRRDREQE